MYKFPCSMFMNLKRPKRPLFSPLSISRKKFLKLKAKELKHPYVMKPPKATFMVISFTSILLTLIFLSHPSQWHPLLLLELTTTTSQTRSNRLELPIQEPQEDTFSDEDPTLDEENCDIFSGEWVPNPKAPYYTNTTCWVIHEHMNCAKYGRPDTEFMKWRWKPDGCELPVFNPAQFLVLMRGKAVAFVGDSVARNQMQSLICLLSRVQFPINYSPVPDDDNLKRWKYLGYNFTMAFFASTHLVRTEESDGDGLLNMYLDESDENWTSKIEDFDYVILSSGHPFFRPSVLYENRTIIGCHYCQRPNVIDLTMFYGFRKAMRTAFGAINNNKKYKGITYFRTFVPSHFDGVWDLGGNCARTRPVQSNETMFSDPDREMYMIQIEEFGKAEVEGRKRGLKFRLLDTTHAMLLRPDGHLSRYGQLVQENVTMYNDCVHWCLPGPIDTWSDFLLEMLKMEGMRSREDRWIGS